MAKQIHIIQPKYVASAVRKSQYPEEGLPEIAFLGRSNVGKSSLINSLCNYRGLARVSGTPGKTQTINYFSAILQEKEEDAVRRIPFFLVDLPGYGFARTGGKKRQAWSDFINEYVIESSHLVLLCLLVDLRHPGLAVDKQAYQWLKENNTPLQIIGTKADKLTNNEKRKNLAMLDKLFPAEYKAVAYSALENEGRAEFFCHMMDRLEKNNNI